MHGMPLKATIFILGSGGFANELQSYIENLMATNSTIRPDSKIYFVDDRDPKALTVKEYYNKISSLSSPYYSIMGSGKCDVKQKMSKEIVEPLFSLIHPWARVINSKVGKGSVIAPGAVLAPRSKIGKHVLCNYNCTIGHDAVIGDLSVVGPNASISGNVTLGEGVYIGAGASVRENLTIGDGAVVGMGAVVIKDVPPGMTVVGVPAKEIRN